MGYVKLGEPLDRRENTKINWAALDVVIGNIKNHKVGQLGNGSWDGPSEVVITKE